MDEDQVKNQSSRANPPTQTKDDPAVGEPTNNIKQPPSPTPFPSEEQDQTAPPPVSQPEEREETETKKKVTDSNLNLPPVIATSSFGKKFGGKQIIATILGLLLLVGAVGAGVTLVQRNQDIREQAATSCEPEIWGDYSKYPIDPADCDYSADNSSGDDKPATSVETFRTCYEKYKRLGCQAAPADPQDDLACAKVTRRLATKYGYPSYECGATAKELAVINCTNAMGVFERWCLGTPPSPTHPTHTPTPTGTPPIGAQCNQIKAYNEDFSEEYSITELSNLKSGNLINFTVSGSANSGAFDMAQFTINGEKQEPVTGKKPGSDEFVQPYTLPQGITNFSVTAQVHHQELDQWF